MIRLPVILLLLTLAGATSQATDLTFGKIISPAAGQKLAADSPIAFIFEVKNINILPADMYSVYAKITDKSNGTIVFADTVTGRDIAPGATQSLTMPKQWLSTEGNFTAEIKISYSQDIYVTNNTVLIELSVAPCCFGFDKWRRGSAINIIQNLNIFPNGEQLQRMRPGDVIAISSIVEDYDMLQQTCVCVVNGDSLKTTKYIGPYQDNIEYEWTLSGPGKLIQPDISTKSAILYEIPLCDTSPAMIQCVIRNSANSSKADDESISGGVILHFRIGPNLPPVNKRDIGNARFLSVIPTIDSLKKKDDEILKSIVASKCEPQPPEWLQKTPITVGDIKTKASDLTCPDYLILLYAAGDDIDSLNWNCRPDSNDFCPASNAVKGQLQPDALRYTWRLAGGKGTFPLGNTGQCVAFWRSKDTALIECEISDSRGQYTDEKIIRKIHIGKSRNPKAYIGIGDISYTKLFINWGDYQQLEETALLANEYYTNAGYQTEFDATAVTNPNQSIRRALLDPCVQAVWIVGHGTDEDSQYKGTIELSDGNNFMPFHISKAANDAFNCAKHPFLRELVLMGCYSALAKWSNKLFSARVYGFSGALINARWFIHESYNWEKEQHFPPAPHDLRMP
ncbi:hypothetical protein MASR2M18_20370 [Ignavibacteria bacterium]|nr:hypothetical protein [Bacteroidota bacterium]MCZ2131775.1 hypothetical protein [Bacteroidota bacterium]